MSRRPVRVWVVTRRPSLPFLFFTCVASVPRPLFFLASDVLKRLTFPSAIQNKDKPKKGTLPQDIVDHHYHAARTVGDEWICYPWEAIDIEEHDRNAAEAKAKKGL